MTTKAIVAGIGEDWVDLLTLDETERAHEDACGSGGSCGSSGCGCRVSGRPFRASNPRNISIRTGDTVEVSTKPGRALGSSLLIFGVPTISGILGFILATRVFRGLGEGAVVFSTTIGVILGFFLIILLSGKKSTGKLPTISGVVQ